MPNSNTRSIFTVGMSIYLPQFGVQCETNSLFFVFFFFPIVFECHTSGRDRLSSDTDIRNIVDQWKRNHTTADHKGKMKNSSISQIKIYRFAGNTIYILFLSHHERSICEQYGKTTIKLENKCFQS